MINGTVTIKEAIVISIEELRKINVPADYLDAIGPHLAVALKYLRQVSVKMDELETIAQTTQNPSATKANEEEPDVEIVEVGEIEPEAISE